MRKLLLGLFLVAITLTAASGCRSSGGGGGAQVSSGCSCGH
jgi:hypothetical protein